MVDRFEQLQVWTAQALNMPAAVLEPVSADASFRRYFRCTAHQQSYIVMDAPPPGEDCRPYVKVAGLMKAAGVHVPDILDRDLERGFLLLSDLGRQSYLDVLNPDSADALFTDAIDALVRWQQASQPGVLPTYDRALLRRELDLFPEWYIARHLNLTLSALEHEILESTFALLENNALAQPQVFVHRDYMPRNLMLSAPNPGVLDFQDAVCGPITYDVVSLFKDAFVSWEAQQVTSWRRQYWGQAKQAGLPVQELSEFERAFDWMGLQRHLKVLGIFARIHYRDGKPDYLKDTPRFLNYVRKAGKRYKQFMPLLKLLDVLDSRSQAGAAAV